MNSRFNPEKFEIQPLLYEEEEEETRGGRRRRGSARKPAVGRKAPVGRKAIRGLNLDGKLHPYPKPPIKFPIKYPIKFPISPLPLPVWHGPLSTPEPARPEPPPSSTPGSGQSAPGSTPSPSSSDQPPEGNEYLRWVQTTLNSLLNLNLRTDGMIDVETRNAISSFQQRAGLPVTGVVGPDTRQALVAASRQARGPADQPVGGDSPAGPDGSSAAEDTSAELAHEFFGNLTGIVPMVGGLWNIQAAAAAPRLIKRETQPQQTTLYVEINLKNVHRKTGKPVAPMTGIFIPDGFSPRPEVDVILYLHGYDLTGCNKTIETYWKTRCQPHFPLREGINQSGRNVILVAPTLGSKSETGNLTKSGMLDWYLDQVLAALRAHGPYAGKPQTPSIGKIILACHSGGGYPMRQIAMAKNRYGERIRECWGFDCTYNTGDDKIWESWARSHPSSKLYLYYIVGSPTAPRAESLKRKKVRNVVVEHSPKSHNWVPITFWKTRLQGAGFLQGRSLPDGEWEVDEASGYEFEHEAPPGSGPQLSPLASAQFGLRTGSKRSIPVYGICVHTTGSGPASKAKKDPSRSALERARDYYLKGSGGFPHYLIAYDGTIIAICDERQVASHAGFVTSSKRERYKTWTAPTWWSSVWNPQGARSPLDLFPKGAQSANSGHIGIEVLADTKGYGFTNAQYESLARLVVDIARRHRLPITTAPSSRLLGHEDVNPLDRQTSAGGWDPGAHRTPSKFSWSRLWSLVRPALGTLPSAPSPAPTTPGGAPPRPPAITQLPQAVLRALGQGLFAPAVKLAVAFGYRDETKLTDLLFHSRHPERFGRSITKGEPNFQELAREWLSLRDTIVRPALRGSSPTPTPAPAPTPAKPGGTGPHPQVNTQLPSSGPGFYGYKPPGGKQYGLRETIQALQAVGAAWNRAYPDGPLIGIGEISQRGGGKIKGHASHQLGVDVDIRLMRNDSRKEGVTRFDPQFSLARTQELINLIHANGILRVRYIFFNDPRATGVSCWPNHDNHLHVRFCAPGDSACVRQIPRSATTQRCTPERLRELTKGKSSEFESLFDEEEWEAEIDALG